MSAECPFFHTKFSFVFKFIYYTWNIVQNIHLQIKMCNDWRKKNLLMGDITVRMKEMVEWRDVRRIY
jgi:hypothetical protein